MKTYLVGQTYEFKVIDIRKDFGNTDYMAVTDGENEYKLYDIFYGQFENLPKTVFAKVTYVDKCGKIKIKQDQERFNRTNYKIGSYKIFRVIEIAEDKNKKSFYKIEDDLTTHNYYFSGTPKYNVGEDVILMISGINDKGFLSFIEHSAPVAPTATPQIQKSQKKSVLDLGPESETLELKTSIVFPAGSHNEVDVNAQVSVILKVLVSFMNAKGGKLYIGVHDKTHEVTGIENDYPHLEEDPSDHYSYQANSDGFELKIRNCLDKRSQSIANTLLSFEFPTLEGHEYCIITVEPSPRPIWLDYDRLHQRAGNRTITLTGDDINTFVYQRMTSSIREMLNLSDKNDSRLSIEDIEKTMKAVINERHKINQKKEDDISEIDYWIIWKNDATWMRRREKSQDDDVFYQLPVPKQLKDAVIVFCYESGTVNLMDFSTFKSGSTLKNTMKDGFYSQDGVKPKSVFLTKKSSLLAGFSRDEHDMQYVKALYLVDFRASGSSKNQGSRFIPKGGSIDAYKIVPASCYAKVQNLIGKKSEASLSYGVPLDSAACPNEIKFVEEL